MPVKIPKEYNGYTAFNADYTVAEWVDGAVSQATQGVSIHWDDHELTINSTATLCSFGVCTDQPMPTLTFRSWVNTTPPVLGLRWDTSVTGALSVYTGLDLEYFAHSTVPLLNFDADLPTTVTFTTPAIGEATFNSISRSGSLAVVTYSGTSDVRIGLVTSFGGVMNAMVGVPAMTDFSDATEEAVRNGDTVLPPFSVPVGATLSARGVFGHVTAVGSLMPFLSSPLDTTGCLVQNAGSRAAVTLCPPPLSDDDSALVVAWGDSGVLYVSFEALPETTTFNPTLSYQLRPAFYKGPNGRSTSLHPTVALWRMFERTNFSIDDTSAATVFEANEFNSFIQVSSFSGAHVNTVTFQENYPPFVGVSCPSGVELADGRIEYRTPSSLTTLFNNGTVVIETDVGITFNVIFNETFQAFRCKDVKFAGKPYPPDACDPRALAAIEESGCATNGTNNTFFKDCAACPPEIAMFAAGCGYGCTLAEPTPPTLFAIYSPATDRVTIIDIASVKAYRSNIGEGVFDTASCFGFDVNQNWTDWKNNAVTDDHACNLNQSTNGLPNSQRKAICENTTVDGEQCVFNRGHPVSPDAPAMVTDCMLPICNGTCGPTPSTASKGYAVVTGLDSITIYGMETPRSFATDSFSHIELMCTPKHPPYIAATVGTEMCIYDLGWHTSNAGSKPMCQSVFGKIDGVDYGTNFSTPVGATEITSIDSVDDELIFSYDSGAVYAFKLGEIHTDESGETYGSAYSACQLDVNGSIVIPTWYSSIDSSAFQNCNLSSISMTSITSIRNRAFYNTSNLESIVFPAILTSIGTEAFAFSGIRSIVVPPSVTSIGTGVFSNCLQLEEAIFSAQVYILPRATFLGCTSLTSIHLYQNSYIDAIGESAFENCINLDNVNLPMGSALYIKSRSFYNTSSLYNIKVPSGSDLRTRTGNTFGPPAFDETPCEAHFQLFVQNYISYNRPDMCFRRNYSWDGQNDLYRCTFIDDCDTYTIQQPTTVPALPPTPAPTLRVYHDYLNVKKVFDPVNGADDVSVELMAHGDELLVLRVFDVGFEVRELHKKTCPTGFYDMSGWSSFLAGDHEKYIVGNPIPYYCRPWTICDGPSEYVFRRGTSVSDRVCRPIEDCPPGKIALYPPFDADANATLSRPYCATLSALCGDGIVQGEFCFDSAGACRADQMTLQVATRGSDTACTGIIDCSAGPKVHVPETSEWPGGLAMCQIEPICNPLTEKVGRNSIGVASCEPLVMCQFGDPVDPKFQSATPKFRNGNRINDNICAPIDLCSEYTGIRPDRGTVTAAGANSICLNITRCVPDMSPISGSTFRRINQEPACPAHCAEKTGATTLTELTETGFGDCLDIEICDPALAYIGVDTARCHRKTLCEPHQFEATPSTRYSDRTCVDFGFCSQVSFIPIDALPRPLTPPAGWVVRGCRRYHDFRPRVQCADGLHRDRVRDGPADADVRPRLYCPHAVPPDTLREHCADSLVRPRLHGGDHLRFDGEHLGGGV